MKSNNQDINKELEQDFPTLARLKKRKQPMFQVPPTYFKELPYEIEQLVAKPTSSYYLTNWLMSWNRTQKVALGMMSLMLVIAGFFWFNLESTTMEQVASLEDIPIELIESYVDENIQDFETELLVSNENEIEDEQVVIEYLLDEIEPELIQESL